MTPYADYAFYTESFLGKSIPAEEFGHYALLATQYINSVTFGRIVGEPIEAVKMACCANISNGSPLSILMTSLPLKSWGSA